MQRRSTDRILPSQRGSHVNRNGLALPANKSPLSPFPVGGRTLPSKWDDAERWICSPASAAPANNPDGLRKPKSKSGPLCRPNFPNPSSSSSSNATLVPSSSASALYCFSPFDTGVVSADEVMLRFRSGVLDEIFNGVKRGSDEADDPCAVSRRDMAMQTSPMRSFCSMPEARASFPHIPPPSSRGEFPVKPEVRDVAVDKRASIMSWSKAPGKIEWTGNGDRSDSFSQAEVEDSSWQFGDTAKAVSWVEREQARIAAWENLQKAKAEAAIRKLEMKLEKKRSTAMERILSKLRAAERKAQEMRESLAQERDALRWTKPLSSWFRCDAF
ncbi:hypothetical protein MLD38_028887 [Melastoma candidum]|uniref:Uncharacterized protein n=1 Tax=Melastoma candidum TaxID=119954 RepID=A0ACB9N2A9_9MYRT|nr:hypothetical protein MLD38_028887 [Melastoma candidum]